MLDKIDKEELIRKYKTNSVIKTIVIVVFVFLAYTFPGGWFSNVIFAVGGLALGYLAYNDHIGDVSEMGGSSDSTGSSNS